MLKNQKQTLEKVIIHLGKSKDTSGLILVCPSRDKWLVDVLVKHMCFDRLSKEDF